MLTEINKQTNTYINIHVCRSKSRNVQKSKYSALTSLTETIPTHPHTLILCSLEIKFIYCKIHHLLIYSFINCMKIIIIPTMPPPPPSASNRSILLKSEYDYKLR